MNNVHIAYLAFTLSNIRATSKAARRDPSDAVQQRRLAAMTDAMDVFERVGYQVSLDIYGPDWETFSDDTFRQYVKSVFVEIRRMAANAERDNQGPSDEYDNYVGNLRYVLQLLQINARSLGLARDLDLDGPDPMHDDLTPYRG